MKTRFKILGGLALAGAALAAAVLALNHRGEAPLSDSPPLATVPIETRVARGAYLSKLGNCMGCHTAQGGTPYAGGRALPTPYGTFYSSNLTPDPDTGLGRWTSAEFWRALHNGRSRDGRWLYPAFPYPSYTHVSREDAEDLYAYFQSLPPVAQPAKPHALRFPYNTQAALAVWRALYFSPGTPPAPVAGKTPEWQRGAYLVQGLGHCAACHSPRNALGASQNPLSLAGGRMPGQPWYAPALSDPAEGGVGTWPLNEVVALLRNGQAPRASVIGPMAEVVFDSTQHWTEADLRATAVYLQDLPAPTQVVVPTRTPPATALMARGEAVYAQHCAQCHGEQGEGRPGAFPPLSGNRAITLPDATNVVQAVLQGGYLPATAGNPQPHGMPPFVQALRDEEVAAVSTFIRNRWGNQAGAVGTMDVHQVRERRGF